MACLGLAWELGTYSGYAAVMRQIAAAAAQRGHRCIAIVRDLHVCAPLLADAPGITLVQAPVATASRAPPVRVQTSHAALLHNCGFADADALAARLHAWRVLFRTFGVEYLLARHSPTAMLAARGLELPLLQYGTGFSVPPPRTPWPGFRPDLGLDETALMHNEQRVLAVTNAALHRIGAAPLATMAALHAQPSTALITYPELDPYQRPQPPVYLGLPQTSYGAPPAWPAATSRPRLFVSLLADASAREWVDAIAQLPVTAILRFTGRAVRMSALPPHLSIVNDAIDFASAMNDCDAVIGYGSHNLACESLLAGKPLALIAKNPDHLMTAQRVKALGAGIVLPERPSADSVGQLQALVADRQYRRSARDFAKRHGERSRTGIAETLLTLALAAPAVR